MGGICMIVYDRLWMTMKEKGVSQYRLMKEYGFEWGGDWKSLKDYQHFEKK